MNYTIDELMLAWRDAAIREWLQLVRDTDGSPYIAAYFRRVGWSFHIPRGYHNSEQFAWCGIFAAAMGMNVGHHLEPGQCVPVMLDPDVAKHAFPSTYRLQSRTKWSAAGVKPPRKLMRGGLTIDELKPGMVCTVGDRLDYGTHIVIVDKVNDDGTIDTIEGNAHGELGDGSWGEGVVRRRGKHARPFSEFRRAYLLDPIEHFDDLTREAAA